MDRKIYLGEKPDQRLSFKEKSKNDYEWAKNTIDYYSRLVAPLNHQNIKNKLYNWYDNIIPEEDFHYVTNPLNSSREQYKNFPAKLKGFNIARKIIDQLIGEYRNRPFNYQVSINNPDAHNKYLEELDKIIEKELFQLFYNLQNENEDPNLQSDVESREVDIEKVEEGFNSTYKDERAIQGQNALEYIVQSTDVIKDAVKQFKDYLIVGEACSYKNVKRQEVIYDRVDPREMTFDETVEYGEDGEYAIRTFFVTPSQLVDMFYDELSVEQIDDLQKNNASHMLNSWFITPTNKYRTIPRIIVNHVTWKTLTKIKIITRTNEFGQEEKIEMPEEYIKKEGEEIEEYWINEVWEGYRVRQDYYFNIRPIPAQRNQINNLSHCKLPYNRIRYSDNEELISILTLCIPYITLYIIVMYMYEMTLSKNGGKIVLMHKGAIPNKQGWDVDKFMYYAKALGFMFIDDKQAGANPSFNQYTVLDMSTLKDCSELIEMLNYIESQLQLLIGMNPQRLGNVSNSAAVGNTERALFQSAIISEELFGIFDDYIRRDLMGLLDCSKFAWLDGKKSFYISNDMRNKLLEIDPVNYVASDFGIHVSNNSQDANVLNQMKNIIQPLAQNGTSPSNLINILKAKNVETLQNLLSKVEKKNQEMAMQQQEQESQLAQQQMQVQMQLEEMKANLQMELEKLKIQGQKEIEQIKIMGMSPMYDENKDGMISQGEMEKIALEREKMNYDNLNKQLDREVNTKLESAKLQLGKYKEDVGLEKEKIKAKTALKNKVSGEK